MSEKEKTALDEAISIQETNLQAISEAIKEKRGIEGTIDAKDFPDEIRKIETGITLPTLTNPATVGDVASNKQFINQNGDLITGTVSEVSSGSLDLGAASPSISGSNVILQKPIGSDRIIRSSANVSVSSALSNFGNAEAADVVSGKTFTSSSGLKTSGSMPNVGGLIKGLFEYAGSSYSTVNKIKEFFNDASFGFKDVIRNNLLIEPFIIMTTFPYYGNSFDSSGVSQHESLISDRLLIPIPTVTPEQVENDPIVEMAKISNNFRGIAFVYLSEHVLKNHVLSANQHIIGGYYLRSDDGSFLTSSYLTIPARSSTIIQHAYSASSKLTCLTQQGQIRTVNSIKQYISLCGMYFSIYVSNSSGLQITELEPLKGNYLAMVW